MYKKLLLCISIIFIFHAAVRFSGCSMKKHAETGTGAASSSQNKEVRLRMTYWGTLDEKIAIEKAMIKFNKSYPWITVEPIHILNDNYNRELVRMMASGTLPDIGYMTSDLGETWANENMFVNIFELIENDPDIRKDDFFEYVWYRNRPDNAWGISTAVECYGLFYNKNLLAKAGIVTLPSKAEEAMEWDEFVLLAKRLTLDINGNNALEPDFDRNNIRQYGIMFETWSEPLNNFIYSNNGKWISDDGTAFVLNSPETVEAIQKLADLINVHHVAPSPLVVKSMPVMSTALESELVAMIIGGQWINLDLGNAKVNYDIGVLPKHKKSITMALSAATVIYQSSENRDEAWILFKWLLDPEKSLELYSGGLWMPTVKKWYTDQSLVEKWVDSNTYAHPPGFKDAMINQFLKNGIAQPRYYLKNQARIEPIVIAGLDRVWLGMQTAEDALEEIEQKVAPFFMGRYETNGYTEPVAGN